MSTLLLELFSEEIPSRMQRGAAEQLRRLLEEGFKKAGLPLNLERVKTFVSPRHLAIQCFGLPAIQPDVREERRGPKIGAPEQAMKGFLQSTGLTLAQCEQRDGYYYATIERKGRAVAEVVKEICEAALSAFTWPKSMRWGSRPLNWVRPLHRIACVLDDAIVPVHFAHLIAGNLTEGHHFLSPATIKIPHAEKYETLMNSAKVIVDFTARRSKIAAEIVAMANAAKLNVIEDEALLDEVTGLVEWPVPLLCTFDKKFLDLPPEVLISEMKNHQRYFPLTDSNGKLTNQFITVANMVNADGGERVKDGNARVVRARLADGEFYWEQDRKVKLEDWGKKLSDVVFHAKVGMMAARVDRIKAASLNIARQIGYEDKDSVVRAAKLCKADLTSGMVGEFPELQGIMGRYYALAQGESPEIADAIRDHYKPIGANDSIPNKGLSSIISLAEKVDIVVSMFSANLQPTGSKDPYAVRRAAQGILKIIIENEYDISLSSVINSALMGCLLTYFEYLKSEDLHALQSVSSKLSIESESLIKKNMKSYLSEMDKVSPDTDMGLYVGFLNSKSEELHSFFTDRFKTSLRDEDIKLDVIEAALGLEAAKHVIKRNFNLLAIAKNTRELAAWLETPTGKESLTAIKRTLSILAAEEKKDKKTFAANTNSAKEPAEKAIAVALANTPKTPQDLEALTAPINQFFEKLLVNEEGKREARLSLLAAVRDAANSIADFSKLEG